MVHSLIEIAYQTFNLLLLARVILSWLPSSAYHPIVITINRLTDPLLRPFQNLIPPHKMGGIDLSPMFAFISLSLIRKFLFMIL